MSEYKQASATLCEAFMEDDVIRYPIDTPDMEISSRERKHGLYVETMDYVTAAHIQSGLVTTMGPNYASVAIWYVTNARRAKTTNKPSGSPLAKTLIPGARSSAADSGVFTISSLARVVDASSPNSFPSSKTPSVMC